MREILLNGDFTAKNTEVAEMGKSVEIGR